MKKFSQPLELLGAVQHYHWGKPHSESIISKILPGLPAEKPLAEIWFGAHASLPSKAKVDGGEVVLSDLISEHGNQLLGSKHKQRFSGALPFLFKVLSIDSPLSIQAHPDLEFAAELHRNDPAHYPDSSHKPEISFAISKCVLFCGLKGSSEELLSFLRLPPPAVAAENRRLKSHLHGLSTRNLHEETVLSLFDRFSEDDPGILAANQLELLELSPGDAVFIPPGVIHAHVFGELFECMASSDNVIRVGLTPKFKDVSALETLLKRKQAAKNPRVFRRGELIPKDLGVQEFSFEHFESPATVTRPAGSEEAGAELIFYLGDEAELAGLGAESQRFSNSVCLFVPAESDEYRFSFRSGSCVRVSIPL